MHQQRCVCPQCGTTLRVKDRAYLNRPIPCPDCRTPLVLKATADGGLEAPLAKPRPESLPRPAMKSTHSQAGRPLLQRLREWSTNVGVTSWVAAVVMATMIAAAMYRTRNPATNTKT